MCQPGRPRPQGESQAVSSSGLLAFQSAKSSGERLPSPGSTREPAISSSGRWPESSPYPGIRLDAEVDVAVGGRVRRALARSGVAISATISGIVSLASGSASGRPSPSASVSARYASAMRSASCCEGTPCSTPGDVDLVVDVGDVDRDARGQAEQLLARALEHHRRPVGPRVADVDAPVDRGTAAVDPQHAGRARLDVDDLVPQPVVEPEWCHVLQRSRASSRGSTATTTGSGRPRGAPVRAILRGCSTSRAERPRVFPSSRRRSTSSTAASYGRCSRRSASRSSQKSASAGAAGGGPDGRCARSAADSRSRRAPARPAPPRRAPRARPRRPARAGTAPAGARAPPHGRPREHLAAEPFEVRRVGVRGAAPEARQREALRRAPRTSRPRSRRPAPGRRAAPRRRRPPRAARRARAGRPAARRRAAPTALAVGADDDRAVREDRLDRAQRAQEQQVPGRVGEVILAAHDVRDREIAVVDRGREVERRPPVRAHEHEVGDLAAGEAHGAARGVLDDDLRRRARGSG